MKFYNPFKLHIAQRKNGNYVLRVSSLLFWSYRDLDLFSNHYWSKKEHVERWCEMEFLIDARKLLAKIRAPKDNSSYFVES